MIRNSNKSKEQNSFDESFELQLIEGVGSVHIIDINPTNEVLRKYGWNIPEDAPEREYVKYKENNGKMEQNTRICLLVEVSDMEDKPVITMNYLIRPDVFINADGTKCKVIDSFIRTAWGTKSEIKSHQIPVYASGPANISSDYKYCHRGEEEILKFFYKYLNITPLQRYDRVSQSYIDNKNPGQLTIDRWDKLCNGDVSELKEYIALQPNNRVKVCFGVQTTPENKSYQTFLTSTYFGNNLMPDKNTGYYTSAQKAIDKFFDDIKKNEERTGRTNPNTYTFSAAPAKKWNVTPTKDPEDNSGNMFDDDGNFLDDLPM